MKKSLSLLILLLVVFITVAALLTSGPLSAQVDQKPPRYLPEHELISEYYYPLSADVAGATNEEINIAADPLIDGRITFASYRNSYWQIYTADGAGQDESRVTQSIAIDYYPRFNRGAARIVYSSERDGKFEIFTMDQDGENVQQVTGSGANNVEPSWSPDSTKIIFQSDRSGQYEIYSMNIDGSGLKRLTYHGAYDGDARYSPDGRQIVFASRRNGYGIWLMNADGSSPRQLVEKTYSENPVWSPDGSKIAFDADGDDDNWQEIWLMNADGSDLRRHLDPPRPRTDLYVRGWSPGSDKISYTLVEWILHDGSFYWTSATPYHINLNGGDNIPFNAKWTREWMPDWQAVDITPPKSAVETLPATSRYDQTIYWSGHDIGGAYIASYDVQYKIGHDGQWQDWQTEVGLYRMQALFDKVPGETVYFRSRAKDSLGNMEKWPAGDGDASITFNNWYIAGRASDNRLTPVPGVNLATVQQPFAQYARDEEGFYAAYFDGDDPVYNIDFQKDGFGTTATANIPGPEGINFDILLPPADNILANPDFEADTFSSSDWLSGGVYAPFLAVTHRHTGDQSVFFGRPFDLESIANFESRMGTAEGILPKQDEIGRFHNVWYESNPDNLETIYYAFGDEAGVWSEPSTPVPFNSNIFGFLWDVSADGRVHILWRDRTDGLDTLYHTWMVGAGWHTPKIINSGDQSELSIFHVDRQGRGHLLWHNYDGTINDEFYSQISSDGDLSAPERMYETYSSPILNMVIDKNGLVHLLRKYYGNFAHLYRLPGGGWSDIEIVAPAQYNAWSEIYLDDLNGVHLLWNDYDGFLHSKRQPDGTWQRPTYIDNGISIERATFKTIPGPEGSLTIIWQDQTRFCNQLYRAQIDGDGLWLGSDKLSPGKECVRRYWLRQYGQQSILLAVAFENNIYHICQMILDPGANTSLAECTLTPIDVNEATHPLIGQDGLTHIFWRKDLPDGSYGTLHTRQLMNEAAGSSRLRQSVIIPAEMLNPTLSFSTLSWPVADDPAFALELSIADSQANTRVLLATRETSWTYQSADLTPWSGQQVTVTFTLEQHPGTAATWTYLDEAFLGSAYPDTWAAIKSPAYGIPGQNIDLRLQFGNRSSVLAEGLVLTATLPAELTYVSASKNPTTQIGQQLVWELGDLSAADGPGTINVVSGIASDADLDLLLPVSVELDSATPEVVLENNRDQILIDIVRLVFLAIISR